MKKQKNVVMLPTENKEALYTEKSLYLTAFNKLGYKIIHQDWTVKRQYLYFTAPSIKEDKENGEEIKDGDWCIYHNRFNAPKQLCRAKDAKSGRVYQNPERDYGHPDGGITPVKDEIFKVIATSNPELWKSASSDYKRGVGLIGVDKIPLDFVEVFVKEQGNIKSVLVEYEIVENKPVYTMDKYLSRTAIYTNSTKPKLNNSGAVKVFPAEEKKYTRKELEQVCYAAFINYRAIDGKIKPSIAMDLIEPFKQWLKENFPE